MRPPDRRHRGLGIQRVHVHVSRAGDAGDPGVIGGRSRDEDIPQRGEQLPEQWVDAYEGSVALSFKKISLGTDCGRANMVYSR